MLKVFSEGGVAKQHGRSDAFGLSSRPASDYPLKKILITSTSHREIAQRSDVSVLLREVSKLRTVS